MRLNRFPQALNGIQCYICPSCRLGSSPFAVAAARPNLQRHFTPLLDRSTLERLAETIDREEASQLDTGKSFKPEKKAPDDEPTPSASFASTASTPELASANKRSRRLRKQQARKKLEERRATMTASNGKEGETSPSVMADAKKKKILNRSERTALLMKAAQSSKPVRAAEPSTPIVRRYPTTHFDQSVSVSPEAQMAIARHTLQRALTQMHALEEMMKKTPQAPNMPPASSVVPVPSQNAGASSQDVGLSIRKMISDAPVTPSIAALVKDKAKEDSKTTKRHDDPNGEEKTKKSVKKTAPKPNKAVKAVGFETISSRGLDLEPVATKQPPVPKLAYGLERVLFNPGVYQLQDSRSKVYNFDPYLQNIMPVAEFDFDALKDYVTSSKDTSLERIAKETGKKYVGSTSSMTSVLSHFHYLLSQWREIKTDMLSEGFPAELKSFTNLQRAPAAVFLKWQNGTYAIDADKEHATANILSMLGKSLEKLLTLDTDDYERYRKSNPEQVTAEEREAPEAFHYSTLGDFLMRSQLDAYDPRLPGEGMFDLKTRSVISIRMDVQDYKRLKGYEIWHRFGEYESYEREYYDMIRSAFLKYSLQVRMGRMDGIFVAFHNTERIFGFQYIPLGEMDYALHGTNDTALGDSEFKLSLTLLNKALNKVTARYADRTIRLHFETRPTHVPFMYIFAEPYDDQRMHEIQSAKDEDIRALERQALSADSDATITELEAKNETNPTEEDLDADTELVEDSIEESVVKEGEEDSVAGVVDSSHIDDVSKTSSILDDIDSSVAEAMNQVVDDSTAHVSGVNDVSENNTSAEEIDPSIAEALAQAVDSSEVGFLESVEQEIKLDQETENVGTSASVTEDSQASSNRHDVVAESSLPSPSEDPVTAEKVLGEGQTPDTSTTFGGSSFEDAVSKKAKPKPASKGPHLDQDGNVKPLLAMTLTIKNKIGKDYVTRPEHMQADAPDKLPWNVEYSLTEIEDPERAWNLYNACIKRRKGVLVQEGDKSKIPFIKMLRTMAQKHKKHREHLDKTDKVVEKKVV